MEATDIAGIAIRYSSIGAEKAVGQLKKFRTEGGKTEKQIDDIDDASRTASGGVAKLAKAFFALSGAAAGVGLSSRFVEQGRASSKALAEVSTLIEGTDQELAALTAASRAFVREFGGGVDDQLGAFYQTISAGASSVSEATETMTQANKLAKGGVTDIATAVDGLTTILNAYGEKAGGAAAVSDAMFVAMRAGKTTIGELSSSIGGVAPLAESAGVSVDEMLASVAALTKGGISTAESVTGLRAILAAVTKPSVEASKAAQALGVDFSTAAIQSQGFAGWLDDLVTKTGGSSEALAVLFGGVEAIVPALALAGTAGDSFNDILVDMQAKAGATDTAVQKIAASMDDRLTVALGTFTEFGDKAGTALLAALVPAVEAAASGMDFLGEHSAGVGAVMLGLAATQIPAAIAGLGGLRAVVLSLTTAARGLAVATAVSLGPWGVLAGLVGGTAAYFLLARDNAGEAETALYDAAEGSAALNAALGTFYTTAAPSAGKSAIDLANDNYKLAESAIFAAEAELAKQQALLDASEAASKSGGNRTERNRLRPAVEAAQADLEAARAALEQVKRERDRAARAVVNAEYSGQTTVSSGVSVDVDTSFVDAILESLKNAGGSAGGGAVGLSGFAEALAEVSRETAAMQNQLATYREWGGSLEELQRQIAITEKAQTLLTEAQKAGIQETPELRAKILSASEAYVDAADKAEQVRTNIEGGQAAFGDFIGSLENGVDGALDFMRQLLLQIALVKATAAGLDILGGTSFGSSLIETLGSLTANATGGVYSGPGINAYSNSVVSSPTLFPFARGTGLMGEAGPEAIMPLTRMPSGNLGVETNGSGGGTQIVVNNYGREPIEENRRKLPDGREVIEMNVGKGISSGRFDKQLNGRFGVSPTQRKRG